MATPQFTIYLGSKISFKVAYPYKGLNLSKASCLFLAQQIATSSVNL